MGEFSTQRLDMTDNAEYLWERLVMVMKDGRWVSRMVKRQSTCPPSTSELCD